MATSTTTDIKGALKRIDMNRYIGQAVVLLEAGCNADEAKARLCGPMMAEILGLILDDALNPVIEEASKRKGTA